MKRISIIIMMCLLQVLAAAASTFSLNVEVTPTGAAGLYTQGGTYEEGEEIYLGVYPHTGFIFKGWYANEEVVSSSTGFYYTMPSHDTTLQARFEYDPVAPPDPDQMGFTYTTLLKCRPAGAGSFNIYSLTLEEGSDAHIYAYTNSGFRFQRWEDEDGNTISENRDFSYVMPKGGGTIYGVFEFDPEPPANPLKNFWNKELGEAIIDDFKPGDLNGALSSLVDNNNRGDVTMITVAGVMSPYDFGIANNYSSCTLLDLSRVTGITEIPSYAFDYTSLETVILPASIEKIGSRAFDNCKQLAAISIYAMTPPVLENNVFQDTPDGLIVYVPAAAISQYQDSDMWKDFTILPIQEDIRNLTVSLPSNVKTDPFARMWLEIRNTKNGQKLHYVMNDRQSYTFANIISNTTWDVTLRNERGDIFGQISNVEVKDEDVSVEFKNLSLPQTVYLTVVTDEGEDISDMVNISWTDGSGNYLGQSASLTGLPAGMSIGYSITLPQSLALKYVCPETSLYTVTDSGNEIGCKLSPIPQIQMSGKIKDSSTGLPLSGTVVTASQTFGGKYTQTVTGKTDRNGEFTLKVFNVPTSLTASASDYINYTIVCDDLMSGAENIAIPEIGMKPIAGAVIALGFTYQRSTAEGVTEEKQDWYENYSNINYSIFNKTKKQPVTQFSVQYPSIVLLEEVSESDVLEITATSLSGEFMPLTTNVVIDNAQKGEAKFDIVELGGFNATFVKNGNSSVSGSLYDSNGKLCKTYSFVNSGLSVNGLKDGKYTLITMGNSKLFNNIYSLDQYEETGLSEGNDYVSTVFDVKSGCITEVAIESVPTLNEAKLYYTGDNTSFTVNKPSIVAGNYLTLTGRIDFKPAYVSDISNLILMVDLPEECDFVENSVMVGNNTSSYTLDGKRLTVPMARITDRVRFCVIPTLGGEYSPSAFARFDLDGETITQPIGAANYTAKDLSLSAPSVIAKTTIPVSGSAAGKSTVEIYDGDKMIGQTQSLANGTWATTCELIDPYNLSKHEIYAKVTTKDGINLRSETKNCTYDVNAVRVSKVTMYHWNPEMRTTFTSEFDFLNPRTSPTHWTVYYPDKKFTYTVEFTNNDPDKISNVILYVHTADGRYVPLKAEYDEQKELWCADIDMGHTSDGYYPVNVSVDFDFESEPVIDRPYQDQCVLAVDSRRDELATLQIEMQALKEEANVIDEQLNETSALISSQISNLEKEDDLDKDSKYLSELFDLLNWEYKEEAVSVSPNVDTSQEFINKLLEEVNESLSEETVDLKLLEASSQAYIDNFNSLISQLEDEELIDISSLDNFDERSFIIETANGNYDYQEVSASEIDRTGWNEDMITTLKMSDGSEILFYYDEDIIIFDEENDKAWILNAISSGTRNGKERIGFDDIVQKLHESFNALNSAKTLIVNMLTDWANGLKGEMKALSEYTDGLEAKWMDELTESTRTQQKIEKLERQLQEMGKQVKNGTSANYMGEAVDFNAKIDQLKFKRQELLRKAEIHNKYISQFKSKINGAKVKIAGLTALIGEVMDYWEIVTGIVQLIDIVQYGIRDMSAWQSMIDYILPCKDDNSAAQQLKSQAQEFKGRWGRGYLGAGALSLVSTGLSGYCSFNKAAKFIMKTVGALVADFIKNTATSIYEETKANSRTTFIDIKRKRANLRCIKNCDEEGMPKCPVPPSDSGKGNGNGDDNGNSDNGGGSEQSNSPDDSVQIDPSGFVYEAVSSNRVEGVVATIFYKEMVEDMYGDLQENIVKWDAAEYAQENPLFTDSEGNYRWDVPQGLWQVRFEKEGYETTFSEWLPVPPPQLEVNIAIKQNVQPNVRLARAFEDAVEVEFDKYMQPESLSSENIIVLADDKPIAGKLVLLNEEETFEESGETFASKIRFNADEPFAAEEVTLLIKNRVKSYADVRMQDDYMQSFAVEPEIRKIECDSEIDVAYGGSHVMKVSVIPAVASAGKTLNVFVASALTISTDTQNVVLDEDGRAEILINGDIPGSGALQFSVEGYDITEYTLVNVRKDFNKVATPKISIASGSTVDKGTEVYLTCDTEGATIIYTLDGSCPCDDTDARKEYDGTPIVIDEDVTIKVIAYAPDMYESEIATYSYFVADTGVEGIFIDDQVKLYPLPMREELNISAGENLIKRVSFTNLSGATTVMDVDPARIVTIDVSRFPAGIYMVTVETDRGDTIRKVMKVK